MTDGTQFETKSIWGSEGEVLKLEIDPKSHCLDWWKTKIIGQRPNVSNFNKKFQNFRAEKKIKCQMPANAHGNSYLVS